MILMTVKYYMMEGQREEVVAALKEMKGLVSEHEPGCLSYQVWESRDQANVLLLQELYVDEAALLAHRETAHFKNILEGRVIPHLTDRVREFYLPLIS